MFFFTIERCQECFLTNAKLNIVLSHLLHSLVKEPYVDWFVVCIGVLFILPSCPLASCHKCVLCERVWALRDLTCVQTLQDCTGKGPSAVQTVLHLGKPKSPLGENSSLTIQEGTDPDARNPDIFKLRKGKSLSDRIHTCEAICITPSACVVVRSPDLPCLNDRSVSLTWNLMTLLNH